MIRPKLWLLFALFLQCAGVVVGEGLTWSLIGSLGIEEITTSTLANPSNLEFDVPVAKQTQPYSWLFVDDSSVVYYWQSNGYNRSRCLKNGQWTFCEIPKDVIEQAKVAVQTSHPEIERKLPRRKISSALYKNLLGLVKIPDLVKELRSAPDWDDSEQFAEVSGNTEEDKIKQRLKIMCEKIVGQARYSWAEGPGVLYGIVQYSPYMGYDEEPVEQTTFVLGLWKINAPPQIFYRTTVNSKKVVLLHNFTNEAFAWLSRDGAPGLFFLHGESLFLANTNKIAAVSTTSGRVRYYETPIKEEGSRIVPAFYHRENELYVLGTSRTSDRRIDILKCDLADIEKAEGP